jgi:CspA family cold shock protein
MATGTIKFFSDKGFGFIKRDDGGKDVFLHREKLEESGVALGTVKTDSKVEFDVQHGDRGPFAVNIRVSA